MFRSACTALFLVACTQTETAPTAPISVEISHGITGQTWFSGCWYDGLFCNDGTDPMVIRSADLQVTAPYTPALLGGHYRAEIDALAGGDQVAIEFDGDSGTVELPLDTELLEPAIGAVVHLGEPIHVAWTPVTNATSVQLVAGWNCRSGSTSSWRTTALASFDVDPGDATVTLAQPDSVAGQACKVDLELRTDVRAHGERLKLVATQERSRDVTLEPTP